MYAYEEIERRLYSSKADERRLATVMIGKARFYNFLEALISTMHHDEDDEVRAMAAWSLDLLSSAEAIPALIIAMYDTSFTVRSNAGWALVHLAQRISPQLVLPEVIDVLQDYASPDARQMAFLVLSNIHHSDSRHAIATYW